MYEILNSGPSPTHAPLLPPVPMAQTISGPEPTFSPSLLGSHSHISHIHATCNPGGPVLALNPQADSLVGMSLTARPAGGWALPWDPAQHGLSIFGGLLRAQMKDLVGWLSDTSHPLSPDLHNPLSFIIMVLSLAGNLCRQDKDDCVDLGKKNSSFR